MAQTFRERRASRLVARVLSASPLSEKTSLLEEVGPGLSDERVQIVIRDVDPETLAQGLAGAGGKVISRFLDNLPNRGREMLVRDIRSIDPRDLVGIRAAQSVILEAIREPRS